MGSALLRQPRISQPTGVRCVEDRSQVGVQTLHLHRSTAIINSCDVVQNDHGHKDDAEIGKRVEHEGRRTEDRTAETLASILVSTAAV